MDDFAFILEEDMHSISKLILPKKLIFIREFHQGVHNNLNKLQQLKLSV